MKYENTNKMSCVKVWPEIVLRFWFIIAFYFRICECHCMIYV